MVSIDSSAVIWSVPEGERDGLPLVVLLHGVGSHEGDLISLVPYLPQGFVYASLRAPLTYGGGWSWYPLSLPGSPEIGPVDEAAEAVRAWISTLGGVHPSVSLLGFSQGGSLSLQLLRQAPESFAFAVVLAGFVVPNGDQVQDARLASIRPSVFYGHGDVDQVIPADAVARTEAWVAEHTDAELTVYAGLAHGISAEELTDVNAFIGRVLLP